VAEIDSLIAGKRDEPADRCWEIERALAVAAMKTPDLLRVLFRAAFVLDPLDEALAAPGLMERVMDLLAGCRDEPPVPAPSREELVAIASS
jgi:hypothetical protein